MKHILAVLVENQPGVLTRISALFSRRGYNIISIAAGETEKAGITRITLVVDEDSETLEQVIKQLHKLVNVIKISDITNDPLIERELCLIKVYAPPSVKSEIIQIVDIFRAKIVDAGTETLVIEVTGDQDKLEGILQLLTPYGIKELVRTGQIALVRGNKTVQYVEEE
ncbi:MAG TPA: acetolactate synthase small subunit [Clostridia bacterium]|jgi:acetolactate synthase-1/3 small subunit|nr:acetolactate synthase small subunit [Clostridia bacterium]